MEFLGLAEVSGNLVLLTDHDLNREHRSMRLLAFPEGKQQEAIGGRSGQAAKN